MTTQNLLTRAREAHSAANLAAYENRCVYVAAKRAEVLSITLNYAQNDLGILLLDDDITLEQCNDTSHPNVFGAVYFWSDGLLFKFLPWSHCWSVANDDGGAFHAFRDLAGLGEVLRHLDFSHLPTETSEAAHE